MKRLIDCWVYFLSLAMTTAALIARFVWGVPHVDMRGAWPWWVWVLLLVLGPMVGMAFSLLGFMWFAAFNKDCVKLGNKSLTLFFIPFLGLLFSLV